MAEEQEWRLCAEWLIRCRVLPTDHPVTFAGAAVFDLAQTLRDGVLLCHLLNSLQPGAVDLKDFSQRPQMSQFLCLKNIRTFLHVCKLKFSLREADLFDSYDLFDVKNFGAVIKTLSKLSKSEEAKKSGIVGFPQDNRQITTNHDYYNTLEELATGFPPSASNRTAYDDEDIYNNLEDLATDLPDEDVYAPLSQDDDQEIYEDLCSVRRRHRVKDKASHDSLTVFPEPKTKREHCLKELVETEKNYVDALNMIVKFFIKPLRNLMTPQDRKIIFSHIEELAGIHQAFHSELLKSVKTNDPKLSACFIKWKNKFLLYGQYCSTLPAAQEHIDELSQRSPPLRQSILDCQMEANDGKFKLRDLLSVPMQRVLKYHLLLRELIKNTDKTDENKAGLEEALMAMQDLALYVNEVKRDDENIKLILEIQSSIVDLQMPENTTLKDYGRLVKDGELKVRPHEENRTHNRYIFLFDKVMLMCKSRTVEKLLWGESYSYKDALVLANYKIDEGAAIARPKGEKWSQQFLLVEQSNAQAYTFYAKTDDTMRKWIDAIKMALDNTEPPGAKDNGFDFIMHTFDKPTECHVCKKLLRGVFFQGYYCQKTRKHVHKECISKCSNPINGRLVAPLRDALPHRPSRTSHQSKRLAQGQVRASYAYTGVPAPDNRPVLKFQVDDAIELLSSNDSNWWEGRINGLEGFFPANYVRTERRMNRKPSYEPHFPSGSSVPPPPTTPRSPSSYVNLKNLNGYKWFVGELSRDQAMHKLEHMGSGTFCVRESNNPQRRGQYAISIKFGSSVKHIKVNSQSDGTFFLADCKMFRSIPELVEYYQQNSLGYSFQELDTKLLVPYREAIEKLQGPGQAASHSDVLSYAEVSYDYAATATNQLDLRRGDRVAITSKAGGGKGWWKGRLNGKTGYFPLAYVEEEEDRPFVGE